MGMTLAELRNSRSTALPSRSHEMCLSQSLVSEVEMLAAERTEIQVRTLGQDDEANKPGRLGDPDQIRLAEIKARLEVLYEDMREHTGTLTLQAVEVGEWTRWRDAHPARKSDVDDKGRPVFNPIDMAVTQGWCDATALLSELGRYAKKWNDEDLSPDDWEFIKSKAAAGDLKALCGLVVEMHEGSGARAPKALSTPSSSTPPPETD